MNEDVYGSENPFVSPILAPEEVLKRYPPTRIYCGEVDPLYDFSLYLAHVLFKFKVPVKMVSVMHVGHGFMGLHMPLKQGLQEIRNLVDLMAEHMREASQESNVRKEAT